jgi:OST3 / OST6 family, transporter family
VRNFRIAERNPREEIMRPLLLQLALLLAATCCSSAGLVKSESKRELLRKLAKGESYAALGDAKFANLVHEGPRAYEVFMLFTASPAQYRCTACYSAEVNFKLAASSYNAARQAKATSVLAAREAVFLVGDMPGMRGTVQKLQVSVLLHTDAVHNMIPCQLCYARYTIAHCMKACACMPDCSL